jgi:hypothetical protein
MDAEPTDRTSERKPWTEPEILRLDMSRAANVPGGGFDGEDSQDLAGS